MKTWGTGMWIVFFVLMGLIGLILGDVCWHYYVIGYLKYYGLWGVALVSAIIW